MARVQHDVMHVGKEATVSNGQRKNGFLELRFNEDKTQVFANIYPPSLGGEAVSTGEVVERLKALGVSYGIREQVILDAIHQCGHSNRPVLNIAAAVGTPAKDGQDARIRYNLPQELLALPVPKRSDGSGVLDWFALEPAKLVAADTELATIIPAQPGIVGKTLTWPIQNIPPKSGKPAQLAAGSNVRASDDGLRLYAALDGYVCLQGDTLVVYALQQIAENLGGGVHDYPAAAIFLGGLVQAEILTHGFLAVRGPIKNCRLRAHGDVYVHRVENTTLVATGNVYVTHSLRDCEVTTPQKVIVLGTGQIVGGKTQAMAGIEVAEAGASDFTATDLIVGADRFSPVRAAEIEEELAGCEANIARISQALKPFATLTVQTTLAEDKRQLLNRLHSQKRAIELRMKEFHSEKRLLSMTAKGRQDATIIVRQTAHPGVWIGVGAASMQVEAPLTATRFDLSAGGKSVVCHALQQAA